jgi:hypothetical protein
MDKQNEQLLWIFFMVHTGFFIATNVFLLVINLAGDFSKLWFFWPLLIWGAIIYGHYRLNILVLSGYFGQLRDDFMEWIHR